MQFRFHSPQLFDFTVHSYYNYRGYKAVHAGVIALLCSKVAQRNCQLQAR